MKILKCKKGFSELVGCVVGLMSVTIMLVISITFIRVVNHQSVLNEFANQMSYAVSDYGMTSGSEIDDRYEQLENSLNISPEISYTASYVTGSKVQYGDLIVVTVKSSETINILGFDRIMEFEITKNCRSKIYWK